ncbi:MAG: hypothetical protein GY792_11480 [Gammaproteobacteria bacterium]|nr:hypothetical protein [Gammaproteobacteria bacterium]
MREIESWSVADMHRLVKKLAHNADEADRLEIRQYIPRKPINDRRAANRQTEACRRVQGAKAQPVHSQKRRWIALFSLSRSIEQETRRQLNFLTDR